MEESLPTRREALRLLGAAAAVALFESPEGPPVPSMRTRPIPSSGEALPVVGVGTWQTFDVGSSTADRRPLEEVLTRLVAGGGKVVDSSPMYGRAEGVVGEIAEKLSLRPSLFLATKVWTTGRENGVEQMERSFRELRTDRIDLMQVHNLVDVGTHLPTLSDWKARGRIRYAGITHYTASAYPEVERLLRTERLDFLQINYSVVEPESGERLLPLAAERGVAVIANRPFGGGDALRRAAGRKLPESAADLGCRTWAQLLLKWILGNPAVTCAIPGTGKLRHLEDNLQAAVGPLPDARLRRRMADAVAGF
ncbi:MAG: aldo/keto reductase [Thermoanaerobaculia bacterium]